MNPIPWYKSNTLRGLLVATVAFLLQSLGLADQFPDAATYVDFILKAIEGGALAYSAYARARHPTPPVTLTRSAADAASIQKMHWLATTCSFLLTAMVVTSLLTGCDTFAISRAKTAEQRAAALLGDFTIYQGASLKIGNDSTVVPEVRKAVLDAAIAAKPVADSLDEALRDYRAIRAQLNAGATTTDKLAIAAANLTGWVQKLTPLVSQLRNVIDGVQL